MILAIGCSYLVVWRRKIGLNALISPLLEYEKVVDVDYGYI